ncbi:MAG: glycosyltransferase family 2 protein [Lacunisphaera sp.]|nr:glycosyltransferase family 2 protein [Lacunisphaera sp.]
MNRAMLLSIIVPVYKEEKNIPEFLRRLQPSLAPITADYEIIFSLDPSPDRTEEVILEHRAKDERLKLLKFSRRVGQPMATLAGLEYSRGDAVIVMDVDLQDPPELVLEMVAKWREGFDIVLPQRRQRTGEPWVKQVVSHVGYKVINKIADVTIPPNTGDFRLMSRRVVNEVVKLKESHGFLRGMVAVVGFRQILLPFDRPARHAGETNYNRFFGSLRIGFNGIFCFSTYALQLSTMLGFAIAGFSFLLMGIYLFYKFMGWQILWGNPTLVILISFLGGIQLISVGILGEYIGRIYEEVRGRPKFIVDRSAGFEAPR